MSPLAGPFIAASVVLGVAGAVKVVAPGGTRVALQTVGLPSTPSAARTIGVVEVAMAMAAIAVGGAIPALGVAAAYAGFAVFAELLRRRSRGRADCGCFGSASAPVSRLHVAINTVLSAIALVTLVDPVPNVVDAARNTPWGGAPFALLVALISWQIVLALTVLPRVMAEAGRSAPRRTLAEVVR